MHQSSLSETTYVESPDEEPAVQSTEKQRARRQFLFTCAAGFGAALSGNVMLDAKEKAKEEPNEENEEIPPSTRLRGAGKETKEPEGKKEEVEKEDPRKILEELQELAEKYASGVTTPDQAREIVPVFRRYLVAIKDPKYFLSLEDLEIATNLVIYKLYYRGNTIPGKHEGDARNLPFVLLDMEAALIEQCRRDPSGEKSEDGGRKYLEDRLSKDILWYKYYNNAPEVWEHGAHHFCLLHLPGEEMVSFSTYSDFLSKLSSDNAISCRVVRNTYKRMEIPLAERLEEFEKEGDKYTYFKLLEQVSKLHNMLTEWLPTKDSDYKGISEEENEAFGEWSSKLLAPLLPFTQKLLTRPTSLKERKILVQFIAGAVKAEGHCEKIRSQVAQWGLDPFSATTGVPRSSADNPEPYGVGQYSTLFLDIYRCTMGDWLFADDYVENAGLLDERLSRRRIFRRNCAPIFLAMLSKLCEDKTFEDYIGSELFILSRHGMREEMRRVWIKPNMSEWGERAALFVTFPGIIQNKLSDEEWMQSNAKWLEKILGTGFPQLYPPVYKKPSHVPGLFAKYEKELVRRAKVPNSRLYKALLRHGRQAFLRSFFATAPDFKGAKPILYSLGFSKDEIKEAKEQKW